ncbi:exopolyphosphatase / guanosine-5'-triphosphate,3'-diphosphate pyrophosphatase [Methylacidimicrobium cyclopophantes]|uniref:Exopolyphosphatase / guanosine-5'-triphosphate,3'-diphosphate pyrophosphatase n=1 Tax=Methylacidimicrobium cyclopophantes TaxID=1041766 RepID=A0A5E6MGV6_9BACT|nr:exopolyphosphatase [Methylacidimicrobium cyclopophantes]VVM08524.1 exopolyphosphatase / guanosine-5'-triphosphate,3'-diphosphate pyrophosphatase [Methylacidimicrobium cyclopophantes]
MPLAAAVDLGSNSFHLLVVQEENGQIRPIDRLKEPVRLAAGLDTEGTLSREAIERALRCLERFGQRLKPIPPDRIRVAGTNTLRKARNAEEFIRRAEQALGHSIDVISGHEEARLIYLGVAHETEDDGQLRLVIDIGGGSTELILGRGLIAERMESLFMGCVSMTAAHFPEGTITSSRMRRAVLEALRELEPIATIYRSAGWRRAIGSSGTILAALSVVEGEGWSTNGITADALKKIEKVLVEVGKAEKLPFRELDEERRLVFAGGIAILSAIFHALGIEVLEVSHNALREGLLYDLLGRNSEADSREKTVRNLMEQFHIDVPQAHRVQKRALHLFEQVASTCRLSEEDRHFLSWASVLHEIGLFISYTQYHKHGAYVLNNLDMPGFSLRDQQRLAFLVRSHRRKYPEEVLLRLREEDRNSTFCLSLLLRIAILLERSRQDSLLPVIELDVEERRWKLRFPPNWLEEHPLTKADLAAEAVYLAPMGFRLRFE